MTKSIFTQIIERTVPAHIIYENDSAIAFLDINPVTKGHTLVIPKTEVEFVWDMGASDYDELMDAVKLVANQLRDKLGANFIGQQIVGVDIPHAHVHLIPFDDVSEFKAESGSYRLADGELAEVAEMLKIS